MEKEEVTRAVRERYGKIAKEYHAPEIAQSC